MIKNYKNLRILKNIPERLNWVIDEFYGCNKSKFADKSDFQLSRIYKYTTAIETTYNLPNIETITKMETSGINKVWIAFGVLPLFASNQTGMELRMSYPQYSSFKTLTDELEFFFEDKNIHQKIQLWILRFYNSIDSFCKLNKLDKDEFELILNKRTSLSSTMLYNLIRAGINIEALSKTRETTSWFSDSEIGNQLSMIFETKIQTDVIKEMSIDDLKMDKELYGFFLNFIERVILKINTYNLEKR